MRRGAWWVGLGTLVMILTTFGYLGAQLQNTDATTWTVIKLGIVIAIVWSAIGTTMGVFVVMILKKNAGR